MGKVLSIIIGLVILALGVWCLNRWAAEALVFVKAAIAITAVIVPIQAMTWSASAEVSIKNPTRTSM
jgi:hypothetical protein